MRKGYFSDSNQNFMISNNSMNTYINGFFKAIILTFALSGMTLSLCHGQKKITNEAIWRDFTFYSKSVPGFNFMEDGRHYSRLENNKINQYDLTTGNFTLEILDGDKIKGQANFLGNISAYYFNDDESKILIESETESIYRRSTKARFHVYDISTKQLASIYDQGKVMYATFSPDSEKVAFVKDNNLYYKNLADNGITQVTFDGKFNSIINGAADWVYEEEFVLSKCFYWSSDSKKLAWIKFDESEVKEFTMMKYNDGLYPEYETFKYPKVGEKNSVVSAHVYNLSKGQSIEIDLGEDDSRYIPRIRWASSPDHLYITVMNRHQNHLQLIKADIHKNQTSVLLEEKNRYYIDVTDDLTFLEKDQGFVWSSEKSGFNHLYIYDDKGQESHPLTTGNYDVTAFYGVDHKRKVAYFQAAMDNPMDKQLYRVSLNGGTPEKISFDSGTNSAQFSSTYDYYVLNHSTINSPASYTVYNYDKKEVRSIEKNDHIRVLQDEYGTQPISFFDFSTSENVDLNGWMIKPKDFDENKEYPVFMFLYGGPGSQQVTDSWKGDRYWWFQMLADQGYIVACVDNRGTGARGEEFKKMTYLQLGHYETIDQIEAAKYLGSLPYADASRIGIFGWSYGGYMSTNCLLKGNDVFKAAIAVAPVTSWKWYDTIYTERYMRTLRENEAGYQNNSPVYYADRLKGHYLLVHGIADDNVHVQHTVEMTNALIKANKQFDTYFYPNRNHGIYGDNARLHLYSKMTNFILQNL